MPMADEIEVEECPAPKQSNSDSERLAKPDRPPLCLSVCIRSLLPVRILCGYTFFHPNNNVGNKTEHVKQEEGGKKNNRQWKNTSNQLAGIAVEKIQCLG